MNININKYITLCAFAQKWKINRWGKNKMIYFNSLAFWVMFPRCRQMMEAIGFGVQVCCTREVYIIFRVLPSSHYTILQ